MARTACVIVNYNDWKRTLNLVKRIVDYTSLTYIMVVNNASTDESREKLIAYNHPKYIFLESDKNGGYGYGNNIGIRKAVELGADYLLIANPDVEFDDNCIHHMLELFDLDNNIAIVGAKETNLGTYGWRYTSGLEDVLSASLFFNKTLKSRYYDKSYFTNKHYCEVDIVPGCFLLIDSKKMQEVCFYDEEFFLYEEEKVLYYKFNEKGYKSMIDLDVSFKHLHIEQYSTSIKKHLLTKERLLCSKKLFLKKYRKFSALQLLFSNLFFAVSKLEMLIYAIFLSIKNKKRTC